MYNETSMCLRISFSLLILFVVFSLTRTQVLEGQLAVPNKLNYLVYIRTDLINEKSGMEVDRTGGGVIINMRWILTAAHNIDPYTEDSVVYTPYNVLVVAGTKTKDDEGDDAQRRQMKIEDVVVHEKYLPNKDRKYDAALIFLRERLKESDTVKQADRFLRPGEIVPVGTKCVVSGWGIFEYEHIPKIGENPWDEELVLNEKYPVHARQGTVDVLVHSKCRAPHESSHHLCYGCDSGRCPMTAKGDSGSPITCALEEGENPMDGVVVAIHIFGCNDVRRKCSPNAPGTGLYINTLGDWIDHWKVKEEITLKDRLSFKMKKVKRFFGGFLAVGTTGAALYGGTRAYYNN